MSKSFKNIAVIGDGGWGTTLALLLCEKGFHVTLWGAFPEYVDEMARTRVNRKFLAGISIPGNVQLTSDIDLAVASADLVVLAVPSQFFMNTLKRIKKTSYKGKPFVSVTKGIDLKDFSTMSDLATQVLGNIRIAVLSGPTIAIEVARKIPTTAVVACKDERLAARLQETFSCDYFRIYTNKDVLGVELCGSVKNVIALACGICDGLGLGTNTKAALLTRGLVEMTRLGKAMHARADTFTGLAGLGDLATTCFSPNSRNRTVGEALGRGKSIKTILSGMDAVAEGVPTARSVYLLSKKLGIEMPITKAVYDVVYKGKKPKAVVGNLMRRSLKKE